MKKFVVGLCLLLLIASVSHAESEKPEYAVPPGMTDAEIEQFLLHAKVIENVEIGSGVTRPRRLVLEHGELRLRAAFKTVDIEKMGKTTFESGPPIYNFTDRYAYERAAYLMDRRLGINRVPVVVFRTIDGDRGAVCLWVEEAISEEKRRAEKLGPSNRLYLEYQQHIMHVFDALILNTDRNLANQLITSDWKLHLIDHSRSFRLSKKLSKAMTRAAPTIPRSQYEAMKQLSEEGLLELMEGLLSRAQVRALLARRDALVAKFDKDVAKNGEQLVFQDEMPGARSPD